MLSPIENLSEKVRNLDREIQALWNKVRSLELPKVTDMVNPKPLTFKDFENTPCTAALEVQLEKLATYFDRRARENAKRAEKLEGKLTTFTDLVDIVKSERGAYYFSGKEDSYKNAAQKVRDLLVPKTQTSPKVLTPLKVWIVELYMGGTHWTRSSNIPKEFDSSTEAVSAIRETCRKTGMSMTYYRVVRK